MDLARRLAEFRNKRFESPEDFKKLNAKIREELPALAWWLDEYFTVPAEAVPTPGCLYEIRNGMRCYCHRDCEALLAENDRSLILLEQYDAAAFASDGTKAWSSRSQYYNCRRLAKEIGTAAGFDKTSPEQISAWLRSLASRPDTGARVEAARDNG
ncbi:MAG: hypothetical protein K6B46_00320, partial [Opitutales bacterium]|nr:hypothetical protein [Opitutales bacterium]